MKLALLPLYPSKDCKLDGVRFEERVRSDHDSSLSFLFIIFPPHFQSHPKFHGFKHVSGLGVLRSSASEKDTRRCFVASSATCSCRVNELGHVWFGITGEGGHGSDKQARNSPVRSDAKMSWRPDDS